MDIKDIFIIGGGINGTGIAADASGRGLSVTLCEQHDLASGTSSASTKLIHGGLRYLENYEFKLVRKALLEREVLMKKAPHLISPLEFVLPYESHLRPAWMIRIGLFLYDHLAKRKVIPGSSSINLTSDIRGDALKNSFKKGFSYYDCFTDDARLVIENALVAKQHGAEILTHTEFVSACRENGSWKILLKNQKTNGEFYCFAKILLNAAGPWVKDINQRIIDNQTDFSIQLVKGSHIVVPKLYEGNFAYILQNRDNRIVFAIPYHQQFTLIGTTDVLTEEKEHSQISEEEKKYLCDIINNYFKKSISSNDIVWSYSGVRCLQNQNTENPSTTTRDYKILFNLKNNLLTIIGGKITTFRDLAEDVLKELKNIFPNMKPTWTAESPLPGGDFENHDFNLFLQKFKQEYSWLPNELAFRYAKSYGTRAKYILQNTKNINDLGKYFGPELYQKEVEYLMQYEWATTAEDILWRRTKLGLLFSADEANQLNLWLLSH